MKKIIIVILLVLVGCNSGGIEEINGYVYKAKGVEFSSDTERLRKYFENVINDEKYVNVALGIYENGDFISYRSSDESDIAIDLNILYSYFINKDYQINSIKLLFSYAVYNEHRIDKDDRMYENVYDFIDFMELNEHKYISKNINKWKYSVFQTIVNDTDKEKYKNFYYDYVINVLKTMNK